MRTVKVNGSAPGKAPKATNYADIKGQGRIPYAMAKAEKTPQYCETGTLHQLGRAAAWALCLRGGDFHHLLGERHAFNAW
jgi:hypothetical protein